MYHYRRPTSIGVVVRYQARKFTCGPASISNAFSVFGVEIEEDTIAEVAQTSASGGTSDRGMKKAIQHFNFVAEPVQHRVADLALEDLKRRLSGGVPVILCVDQWSHWVTAIGRLGDTYIIVDPASKTLVLFLTTEQLLRRWRHDARYYGIGVHHGSGIQDLR